MSLEKYIPQPHLRPVAYFKEELPCEGSLPSWAVHTKPRAEKKLTAFLEREGIHYYLPTSLRQHVYGSREPRMNWVPLFPGYVFILQQSLSRSLLYRSNAVVKFIDVDSPIHLYEDLRNVWLALSHKPAEVELALYKPGAPVEVRSGPLKGVMGEIIETGRKKTRLIIHVRFFERAVSVEIDAGRVRPI